LGWLRSFRGFVGDKEPENLSASDIRNFLSFLAVERRVSGATQSQALNALVFFYRNVLDKDPTDELGAVRAMPGRRFPVVLPPGRLSAAPRPSSGPSKGVQEGALCCGDFQGGIGAHPGAQLRNPPAGKRLRHPNHTGTPRPQEPQDHHDLHPCRPKECPGREKPPGSMMR